MSDAQKYRVKDGATYMGGYPVDHDKIGEIVVKTRENADYDGDFYVRVADNPNDGFYVNEAFLEPVEVEFKVGDRVRAESKTSDDVAEFTVTYVSDLHLDSAKNSYTRHSFNFTLLARKPEPLKVGDEVLIDDERIPGSTLLVRDDSPLVKAYDEVVWASYNTRVNDRTRPAKIVWLPES